MANARAMMIAAERNMASSRKELEGAREFLKEAEVRWEVIDVDSAEGSSRKRRKLTSGTAKRIVLVEGAGLPEVNGAYKQSDDGYAKKGRWKGKEANFEIHRKGDSNDWKISVGVDGHARTLYRKTDYRITGTKQPPESDWIVMDRGKDPAPTLKNIRLQ